jgi:hypothetical protein
LTLFEETFISKNKKVALKIMPKPDLQGFQSYSLSANTTAPTGTDTLVLTVSPAPSMNYSIGIYGVIMFGLSAGQSSVSIPNALAYLQGYGLSGSATFYAYSGGSPISNGVTINLSSTTPTPPQTKNISVTVIDNTGAGVPGCQVGVMTTSNVPLAVNITNGNGYFHFVDLPVQPLIVFATYQAANLQVITKSLVIEAAYGLVTIPLNFNYALTVQAGSIIVNPPAAKIVTVTVTDNTGSAVRGCQVGIMTTLNAPLAVGTTDAAGHASFNNIPSYQLIVFATYQAADLTTITNSVNLGDSATTASINLNFNYALTVQAGTLVITPPPVPANFSILNVLVTDRVTNQSYQWINGSWNIPPYITAGASNLKVLVSLKNNGGPGAATVTVTPSSGSAQTTTTASIGSGASASASPLYFTMPSTVMSLTVSITP